MFRLEKLMFAALLGAAAYAQEQAPAPCLQKPAAERAYTKDRLLGVIRDQTPARAEYLIRQCGVAVAWSDALVPELKAAKASDAVVAAVRDMSGGAKAKVVAPIVPPNVTPVKPPPPAGPKPGEIRTNNKEGVTYAFIPAGTFEMGCGTCDADEQPVHKVRITKGFWMAQTEVKVGAYKNYVKAAGIKMPPEPVLGQKAFNPGWASDEQPMSMVLWQDAQSYCQWAGMRLPTEAEWEYAARGPNGLVPQDLTDIAWYADNSGQTRLNSTEIQKAEPRDWIRKLLQNGGGPHDVGQKTANGWKLHDMQGNVWEWTADWYRENAYAASGADDPTGPDAGLHHVLRGGSWLNLPAYVRVTKRTKGPPEMRLYTNGFRCAGASVR